MKKLLRVLLLSLLALAVLGALVWFGGAQQVISIILGFQTIYLLAYAVVLLAHEVVRGLLWYALVQPLAPSVSLRTQLFAFAAGEAAKNVPTGAYFQNYVLQRTTGTDFGRTSAATTMIIVGEIVASLAGVVILNIGAASDYVRPIVVIGAVLIGCLAWAYHRWPHEHAAQAPNWVMRRKLLRRLYNEVQQFRAGAAALLHPRFVGLTLLLTGAYILLAGACLWVVVVALHVSGVSFWEAVAVTCFGLAFYVILGSIEAADAGALIVIGVSRSDAVSIILVNRVLGVGMTMAMAALTVAALGGEARAMLWPRRRAVPDEAARRADSTTSPEP